MTSTSLYIRCEACRGTGHWSGMFHRGACAACGGVGAVMADGSPIAAEEAVFLLRQQLNERNDQLRQARAELRQLRAQRSPGDTLRDAVYPPGSRYHGD